MTHVFTCNGLGMMLVTEIRGSKAEDGVEGHAIGHGDVESES